MPKAFTPAEKEQIRARLREQGGLLFEKRGIQKTSVDELAHAAGISKGAFYLFYPSKEELLLEILEEIESEMRAAILNRAVRKGEEASKSAADILGGLLLTFDKYPLLKNFGRNEFEYLVRKLPVERVAAHAQSDEDFAKDFTRKLKKENIKIKTPPRVIANLLKSLFFVSLHREDMGGDAYEESMQILVRLVARHITEG